jgi:RNA polymerase sigma-70 factor (ECF subfamily)
VRDCFHGFWWSARQARRRTNLERSAFGMKPQPMDRTSASLLERLRDAEPEAWTRFVELYTPLLFSWTRKLGLQEADAADLVQDVLILLFRKLPEFTYDKRQSFRGWLRAITLNKWRERRRRSVVPLEDVVTLDDLPGRDDMAALEEDEYRRRLIARALALLRPEFSEVTWKAFEQFVLVDRPGEDVAVELGVRVGTVYAAKSRVLSRLRQELAGLLD